MKTTFDKSELLSINVEEYNTHNSYRYRTIDTHP